MIRSGNQLSKIAHISVVVKTLTDFSSAADDYVERHYNPLHEYGSRDIADPC